MIDQQDYQQILEEVQRRQVDCTILPGEVANYIPELGKISPDKFGMHLSSVDKDEYSFGDCEERFSIQSISKVLSLALALLHEGETLWERVDVEPSGDPFNSLIQLEHELGIPRNPLINAGALVVCDILMDHLEDPKKEYLEFVRKVSRVSDITYNESVAESEKREGSSQPRNHQLDESIR